MKATSTTSHGILKKAAKHHGLFYGYIDKPRNKILKVTDKRKFFISSPSLTLLAGIYPTNPSFSKALFRDKAWTKEILKKHHYKVTRGDYFYLNPTWVRTEPRRSKKTALEFAKRIGYPVFVKPNSGSLGKYASVIYNRTQLGKHLRELKTYDDIFLIEKVELFPEYRIFVVGGKVMFTYRRERTAIVGDGQSPIMDLLERLHIAPTSFFMAHIKSKKMSMKSVLQPGDKLEVTPVANISQGSKIRDYRPHASKETQAWIKDLSETLSTHVYGLDVFASNGIDDPTGFKIIEINHQPGLAGIWEEGHRDKVYEIWGLIFKKFFT